MLLGKIEQFCEGCDHERDLHIDNRFDCIEDACTCLSYISHMNVIFLADNRYLDQELEVIIIHKFQKTAQELMEVYPNLKILTVEVDAES